MTNAHKPLIDRYFPGISDENSQSVAVTLEELHACARRWREKTWKHRPAAIRAYRQRAANHAKRAKAAQSDESWQDESARAAENRFRASHLEREEILVPEFLLFVLSRPDQTLTTKRAASLERRFARIRNELQALLTGQTLPGWFANQDAVELVDRIHLQLKMELVARMPRDHRTTGHVDLGGAPPKTLLGLHLMVIADYLKLTTGRSHWTEIGELCRATGKIGNVATENVVRYVRERARDAVRRIAAADPNRPFRDVDLRQPLLGEQKVRAIYYASLRSGYVSHVLSLDPSLATEHGSNARAGLAIVQRFPSWQAIADKEADA